MDVLCGLIQESTMKTILIIGASSGLGKAAAKGWAVIATMRNPEKETELSQIANVHLLQLDIGNHDQITEMIGKAIQISPVDVLFNNAGYVLMGPMEAMRDGPYRHHYVIGRLYA